MEGNGPCLDTVRALHQTVVSLRAALEQSRSEILELRDKAWPLESVESALRALSIENHVLRRRILENGVQGEKGFCGTDQTAQKQPGKKHVTIASPPLLANPKQCKDDGVLSKVERVSPKNISRSLENLSSRTSKKLSISKTVSYSNITDPPAMDPKKPSEINCTPETNPTVTVTHHETQPRSSVDNSQTDLDQDQEVDDIELIFTTDDTKDSDFKEQLLVSIEAGEQNEEAGKHLQCPASDFDQTLDVSDRELEDDVFKENDPASSLKRDGSQLCSSRSDNSINQEENKSLKSCYSYQDSSFENKSLEKDESFDRFEERIRIIETDISKVGIQDVEYGAARRNTCPNPLQYRPMAHRYTKIKCKLYVF